MANFIRESVLIERWLRENSGKLKPWFETHLTDTQMGVLEQWMFPPLSPDDTRQAYIEAQRELVWRGVGTTDAHVSALTADIDAMALPVEETEIEP